MNADYRKSPLAKIRFEKQGGRCFLCGKPINLSRCSKDHFIPVSKHGLKSWGNVVLAHARCNSLKGDGLPDWEDIIRFEKTFGCRPGTTKRQSIPKIYRKYGVEMK